MQLVGAALAGPLLARVVEDGRVLPGGALDAVVLAERVRAADHHAVGPVALPARVAQLVHARRVGVLGGVQEQRRVEDRQGAAGAGRSEEHTSELQSLAYLVCRLLLEKKKR